MLAIILFGCIALACSAPTEQGAAASAEMSSTNIKQVEMKQLRPFSEFLILTPEAQLQLQPALKLQQPVIQPLIPHGSPATRQFDTICNQIISGAGTFQEIIPFPLPWGDSDSSDQNEEKGGKFRLQQQAQQQMPEINTDAETIPQGIIPQTPASTYPLPERRFYTIAGRPQFFGNVDILQNPLHPLFSLQPLQAIKARSITDLPDSNIQNDRSPIKMEQSSEALPLPLPLQSNEQISQEQQLLADNAARNFAKALQDLEDIRPQSEQAKLAADAVALEFASRFDSNQVQKVIKEDSQAIASNNDTPSQAAAKSVDSPQNDEASQMAKDKMAEPELNAKDPDSEQQQPKTLVEKEKEQVAEK